MKITVRTAVLQTLVAKSMKGASCNKMIPITGFMAIELKDHTLRMITTDSTNYLYVSEKVEGEDFYAVVQAEVFSKLISKLTCERVTLEINDKILTVSGNGKYSIELPLDEDGELIKYPDPIATLPDSFGEVVNTHLSTIKLILSTAKASLATTDEIPCYTGYYVSDKIVATDTYKMCGIDISILPTPALISADMMNLLDVFTDEHIDISYNDSKIMFTSQTCTVIGDKMESIEDYQIDAIEGLLDESFSSSCKISKTALLQLLDRLALFVSAYDKNGIYLTFTNEGIQVESKKSTSVETIPYMESTGYKPFRCCIDIEGFRSLIKANNSDAIVIHYGEDNAIKITDGNVTQVIALLEDD